MRSHGAGRLPTAEAAATWREVAHLARPQRGLAGAALVVLVAGTAVSLLVPLILGSVIDAVVEQRGTAALTAPIAQLFGVAIATAALGALGAVLVSRVGETVLAALREALVLRALGLPLAQLEAAGSGDLVARISGDVATVSTAVRSAVPQLVRAALTIVLTLLGMFALDWRFAIAGLVAAPVQIYTLRWYLARSTPLFARERVAVADRTQRLVDAVRGAETVRAYGLAGSQVGLIRDSSQAASGLAYQINRVTNRFYGRLNLAEALGLCATLAIGFVLVRQGAVTVGAATAAALFFHRLFDPINTFLGLFGTAQEAGAALARMVGVLHAAEVSVVDGPAPAGSRVRIESVGFRYTDREPVLHGVDLELAPGEHVAVVGPSGAGKSTLAGLVAAVHSPTSGRITIGGVEVDRIGPLQLRKHVYLVTQEVHVFAGTVGENLRLAKPAADSAELAHALAMVEAQDWVDELPQGADTLVGEGGWALTGTQAQQLALARLVLADPALVVLDEATADSGSAGARLLDRAAARALAGRTALIVAHRLTQAADCDRVAVMQDGRITELGTPSELVSGGGTYASLWEAWSGTRTLVAS